MAAAERIGWGVAGVGHVVLFGVLSLGLAIAPKPVPPLTQPVDIQIVDEVGLADTAPNPSPVEPAASVAPEVGPPVEAPPPEPAVAPLPKAAPAPPKPTPAPAPKPAPKAAAKPAPAARPKLALDLSRPQTQQAPRGSRLGNDFLKGVSDRPTASTSQAPRAPAGPAIQASLGRELLQQLRPHWQRTVPSGADIELLRTTVDIRLNRDGSVASVQVVGTTGKTDSNKNQVRLHQEAAIKAVRLASPFVFPSEHYDAWQFLQPTLDKRLLR
jgi:outer membrane biosynthesis protein TonB